MMGKYDLAYEDYRRAIHIKPDFADALLGIGNLHKQSKQYPQALKAYQSAKIITPNLPYLKGALLNTKMLLCDWSNYDNELQDIESAIEESTLVTAPFPLLALSNSPAILKRSSELYSQALYPPKNTLGLFSKRAPNNKIRIGYFSADFHNHATSYLIAELFELHNRDIFELYAFSYGPVTNDPMQMRIRKSFSEFYDVSNKSDLEIAKFARDLAIQIAIDLGGHTANSRTGIFAYRAAPIQVNFLAYPGTMGSQYYDYLIADKTVIPENEHCFYSEKILYMPQSYQVNDRKRKVSTKIFTKEECEIPENSFVFCCFNNNYKITPNIFESWMNILRACPESILWLLEGHPIAKENIRKQAKLSGIATSRLVFARQLPIEEHLSRIRLADLFLDTSPYNAHTTCSDALWMGVPVITKYGKTFPSRVAASLLKAVELPQLICQSWSEYEGLAIQLWRNTKELYDIRTHLEKIKLNSNLFNTDAFVLALEKIYAEIANKSYA